MERKIQEMEIRGLGPEGVLEGYASVKGDLDAYGDVVADGAYGDLGRFVRDGFVTVGHDHSGVPIGFLESAREDARGLFVRMRFHSTALAQEAWRVAKERFSAGKSVGLSIGYVARDWTFEDRAGRRVRVLRGLELKEFSLVTVPAAAGALATSVKSGGVAGAGEGVGERDLVLGELARKSARVLG